MKKKLFFIISVCLFFSSDKSHGNPNNSSKLIQINLAVDTEIKGICLVVHGLNFKPEAMKWFEELALSNSIGVVRLNLKGHGTNFNSEEGDGSETKLRLKAFKEVTWQGWMNETNFGMKVASSIADSLNVPLYAIGFSLGGLTVASINDSLHNISSKVLIAPALRSKGLLRTLTKLLYPFPKLVIPSATPKKYRMNRGTTVRAYRALFRGERAFMKNGSINNCLIFLDQRDELVNSNYIKRNYQESNNIKILRRSRKDCEYCKYQHLMVDSSSLGTSSNILSTNINKIFQK